MASLKHFALTRVGAGLAGILLALAVARWMPVADFAHYVLLLSASGVAAIFSSFGLDRVIYRYVPEAHMAHDARFIFRLGGLAILARVLIGGAAAVLVLLLSQPVLSQASSLVLVALFTAILGLSEVLGILANSLLRFELQARLSLAILLLRLASLGVLYWLAGALSFLVVVSVFLVTECLLALSLGLLAVRPALAECSKGNDGGHQFAAPGLSFLFRQSFANYGSYLCGLPWQGSSLRLIVGHVAGVPEIALFGFVQTLADRARQYLPIQLLQNALEPLLTREYALSRDPGPLQARLDLLRRVNFCLLLLGACLAWLAGSELVVLLTAGKYQGAGPLCAQIALMLAIASLAGVLWISANVLQRMPELSTCFAGVSLALLPALYFAGLGYGAQGVVWVACLPPLLLWAVLRARKSPVACGIWRWHKDLLALLAGLLALAAALLLKSLGEGLIYLLLSVIVLGGIFAMLCCLLRVFTRADLNALRQVLKSGQGKRL